MAEQWFEKWKHVGLINSRNAPLGRRLLPALFLCFLANAYLSAQPKAFASLQPDRIETGDTTGLLLLVSGLNAAPGEVDFSSWTGVLPVENIIGRTEWRRSGAQWTRRFTLIAFDSASIQLPPLKIRLGSGEPMLTNELNLQVFATRAGREISDMARIRDIRREPESWMDYWPWMAGILILCLCFIWWLRKSRNKPAPVIQAPHPTSLPLSPADQALQKLAVLKQKQLWKHDQTKEHYAELSLILREYLELQYRIAALESTTAEILQMLSQTSFPTSHVPELKNLLQKTDLVKYAQSQPPQESHEAVLVKARSLIEPPVPVNPAPLTSRTGKYEPL